jgi:glutaredoxin-like YruB-family protein
MAKVTVYSTKECPWCKKTKEFLKENKINFTNKDVGDDSKAAQEMIKKSGQQGVPVTDIDGTIIVGFDEGKLKSALKIK